MTRFAGAFVLQLSMSACGGRDTWEGFAYPDRSDLTRHITLGAFRTLQECRASALSKLQSIGASDRGDYECGRNCRFDEGMGDLRICEVTER